MSLITLNFTFSRYVKKSNQIPCPKILEIVLKIAEKRVCAGRVTVMEAENGFCIDTVIEMLDEKIRTGEAFNIILYEFCYGRYECEFFIKRAAPDRPYTAEVAVEIPDTGRMYSYSILRSPTLEEIREALLTPQVQEIIIPYVELLIERLRKGD